MLVLNLVILTILLAVRLHYPRPLSINPIHSWNNKIRHTMSLDPRAGLEMSDGICNPLYSAASTAPTAASSCSYFSRFFLIFAS